jgi:hypothetical protein
MKALAEDVKRRLGSSGDAASFDCHGREAVLLELSFTLPRNQASPGSGAFSGWGLCLALDPPDVSTSGAEGARLLALAYGPASNPSLGNLCLSALDSIAPTEEDAFLPGPVTEFAWPRGESIRVRPANTSLSAEIRAGDAGASRALVEREYAVLAGHANRPYWKEAWGRFYRLIFRDAWSRLSGLADALIASWENSGGDAGSGVPAGALAWVQGFQYERDLAGTDFVDPVNAAIQGRGDCDSRALLWALILERADIRSAIMVSREYSHAMGLADIEGDGARFDFGGVRWLVAETTAGVPLGRINAATADPARWIGIALR